MTTTDLLHQTLILIPVVVCLFWLMTDNDAPNTQG